jgi:AraC family transcriptional regulator
MYAVRPFMGTIPALVEAWAALTTEWLPGSGFQVEDRPAYEYRAGLQRLDAQGRLSCDLCIPVAPL